MTILNLNITVTQGILKFTKQKKPLVHCIPMEYLITLITGSFTCKNDERIKRCTQNQARAPQKKQKNLSRLNMQEWRNTKGITIFFSPKKQLETFETDWVTYIQYKYIQYTCIHTWILHLPSHEEKKKLQKMHP